MSFATLDQILLRLSKNRFTPTEDSDPTIAQILARADSHSQDLAAVLTTKGYDIPATPGEPAYDKIAEMNADYVGAWLINYLWNKTARAERCPAADLIMEGYKERLKMLQSGQFNYLFAPALASPPVLSSRMYSSVSDVQDEPLFVFKSRF